MKYDEPFDLSLPIEEGFGRAWYVPGMERHPVRIGSWVGSVEEGGAVNFYTLHLNPHAHGSHTETLGHICQGSFPVNQVHIPWAQTALVISITPEDHGEEGQVINWAEIERAVGRLGGWQEAKALVVRTLPNPEEKRSRNYDRADAPYFAPEVGKALADVGINHWLVDLPSVDREEDGGALACHRTFWRIDQGVSEAGPLARTHATISELIFVPPAVKDGVWRLHLSVAPIASDAAPCRPLVWPIDARP